MQSTRTFAIFAAVAGLTLVLRLCPLLRPGITWAIRPDSIGYMALANGISAGCGFAPWSAGTCGPAELERTPGYPLFLAALPSLRSVLVLQSLLGSGACLLVGLFAWKRWGLAAGLMAEMIAGFDIPSIISSNHILSETLFTSLITSAVVLQLVIICKENTDGWTSIGMLGFAFLLGIAALVRPIGQVLIVAAPLGAILLPRAPLRKKLSLALLVLAVPIAVVASWSYRNYQRRGVWTFSTIGAVEMYYVRAAGVLAFENGKSVDQVKNDLLRSDGLRTDAPDLWSETADANAAEMKRRALHIIFSHPWVTAFLTFKGSLRQCFWVSRSDVGDFVGQDVTRTEAGLSIGQKIMSTLASPTLSILLLADFGLIYFTWIGVGFALSRIRDPMLSSVGLVFIPLAIALLLLAAPAGPEAGERYRVPAMPMLALVAAFGWQAHRSRSRKSSE